MIVFGCDSSSENMTGKWGTYPPHANADNLGNGSAVSVDLNS